MVFFFFFFCLFSILFEEIFFFYLSGFFCFFFFFFFFFAPRLPSLKKCLFLIGQVFWVFFFFCILALHPQHMEVPQDSIPIWSYSCWPTPQPQQYGISAASAMSDQSCICDLHHSSQQCQILHPLGEARDRTLMVPSRIRFHCTMTGMPVYFILFFLYIKLHEMFVYLLLL